MLRVRRILAVGCMTLALLAVPGALAGCRSAPAPSARTTVALTRTPAEVGDVAVSAPASGGPLARPLRDALYRGLVGRGFSVLDLAFVDGGGRGDALLLTSIAPGPEVTGVRTALYDRSGRILFDASVAAPSRGADAAALAELLLRDVGSN